MTRDETASKLRSLSIDRSKPANAGGGVSGPAAAGLALAAAAAGGLAVWFVLPRTQADAPRSPAAEASVQTPAPPSASDASPQTPPPSARPAGRLVASGYVIARRRATVSSDITGRLEEILVEEGDAVEEGQILARLDDARARIDLNLAIARLESERATIARTKADLGEARRVLRRAAALRETNASTEARVTEAATRVEILEADLRRAEAGLAAAEFDVESRADLVDRHLVRAPFSGVVIDKNAQAGEIVSPTSAGGGFTRTGVYTLVDMNSLEIEVDVNEGSIDLIRPGLKAEAVLDAYADWRIAATVIAIIPTADRSRGTIQVRVGFAESDPRILPDMAAKVTFLNTQQNKG